VDADADTVIVVHGLGRTPASMTILVERLEAAGFRVLNFGYPSTDEPIESLVARLRVTAEDCCAQDLESVHFVTHSMGGLLVRFYLGVHSPNHAGRVVMLAPPNQGSEVADFVTDLMAESPVLGVINSWLIPGPDDGKVAVDRARLEGADAFLVVEATHTFIMNHRGVADQSIYFLHEGRFLTGAP
jgi:triacylglycerol lipase